MSSPQQVLAERQRERDGDGEKMRQVVVARLGLAGSTLIIRNYNNFAHNHESFDCSRSRRRRRRRRSGRRSRA